MVTNKKNFKFTHKELDVLVQQFAVEAAVKFLQMQNEKTKTIDSFRGPVPMSLAVFLLVIPFGKPIAAIIARLLNRGVFATTAFSPGLSFVKVADAVGRPAFSYSVSSMVDTAMDQYKNKNWNSRAILVAPIRNLALPFYVMAKEEICNDADKSIIASKIFWEYLVGSHLLYFTSIG